MHCHLCGHKIGAWNTDPYKIGDRPVCDRCWNSGGDQLAENSNRDKVAAQQRELEFLRVRVAELEKGVRRDEQPDLVGAAM